MTDRKQLKLGFIMEGPGRTQGDWRHPDVDPHAMIDLAWFVRHAQEAERGKFDFVFYADNLVTTPKTAPYMINRLEPMTLLAGLAMVTDRIGLAATVSSTYSEPFNVARQFLSLDHMSKGRAGWNVVTTWAPGSHENFGHEKRPDHDLRYQMADEHLDVVQALWDSWEDGALLFDKQNGRLVDPDKMHRINHKGPFYNVAGPLNISRSPQGQPVIFQAGGSDVGRDFAARRSDAIFVNYDSIEEGREYCGDIKARAVRFGRDPDKVLVMPSITPFVGSTEQEAQEIWDKRAALIPYEGALVGLAKYFDSMDLTRFDPDAPFPDVFEAKHMEGTQYQMLKVIEVAKSKKLTLRQTVQYYSMAKGGFVGTPEFLADKFEAWFRGGAADGFIVGEAAPEHLTVFVDQVIPILQKRGIVRNDYEGRTFRDHLGLDVPPNRFTAAKSRAAVA